MSSNVGQNYPYTRETEAQRAAAIDHAEATFDGLRDRIANEATPLEPTASDEPWWVWACPVDAAVGRLHVAGYARERHAVYVVCDNCGKSFLR